jgi:hypothetical protein
MIYHLFLTRNSHIIALQDLEEKMCKIDRDYITTIDIDDDEQLKFIVDVAQTSIAVQLRQVSIEEREIELAEIRKLN